MSEKTELEQLTDRYVSFRDRYEYLERAASEAQREMNLAKEKILAQVRDGVKQSLEEAGHDTSQARIMDLQIEEGRIRAAVGFFAEDDVRPYRDMVVQVLPQLSPELSKAPVAPEPEKEEKPRSKGFRPR